MGSLSRPKEAREIYHERNNTNDYNPKCIIQILGGRRERLSANDTIQNEKSFSGENIQGAWNHGTIQPVQ